MTKSCITLEEAQDHHGKIIKYYRSNVINPPSGWTQEQLAEAVHVSVRWIQEMERMPFIHNMNRRKALSVILSIPPALLGLEEDEKFFHYGTTRLESWIIDSLENETCSRWQLYYTSNNIITEKGLQGQIEILEQIADNNSGDHSRIYRILAQNYQLAGSLARDNFHYSSAKKYFRESQRLADEAKSVDLAAISIARYGVALLRQERIEDALEMFENAIAIATRAEPYTKAYIQTGLAEALARNNRRDECYRSLEQAQKLFERSHDVPIEEDFAHIRLTEQSLKSTQGECYVLLGESHKGLDFLRNALQQLDPTMSRRRCRLLMQQAEAHLVAGQLDYCIQYTLKGLQLAKVLKSNGNINWASEIHTKLLLSKWKNEPIVGELGATIIN